MTNLAQQALKLIIKIDELLEPLEDCFHCEDVPRAQKLRKVLFRAEVRYYRRRNIKEPTKFSMVAALVEKHRPRPELEIKMATGKPELTYVPRIKGPGFWV